ncbi:MULTISPECIES: LysR substrate-binding domain-containing protein [unclassified Streptomyces]|uniref:LysR substrate-binding domain-containing protein n=1 Tax=unclassified Streptomyces TaxID=2593676 RepID=UPI002741EDB4|nr:MULTISPECIES: LysR substrate-binding domain-containing protein [unclassified Streptomyces]
MELRQIRYFLALAEECHFGRAAARLHMAQPALSQQIKQLETDLGTSLFTRSTRHVALTEAGHHLVEHARALVAEEERARLHMRELATGEAGRVSIGFIGTATYDVLPRVARTVRARLPGISMELRGELLTPDLVDGLLAGTYDLAVLRGAVNHEDIRTTPLRSESLVAVLPSHHPLAGQRRISLKALAGEPFVVHPSRARSSMYDRVLAACRQAGFQPASLMEVGETATLVVFVAAGHGVALVPESVQSLRLGSVAYVPLAESESIDLALARLARRSTPAIEQVSAVIEECVDDLGSSTARP